MVCLEQEVSIGKDYVLGKLRHFLFPIPYVITLSFNLVNLPLVKQDLPHKSTSRTSKHIFDDQMGSTVRLSGMYW